MRGLKRRETAVTHIYLSMRMPVQTRQGETSGRIDVRMLRYKATVAVIAVLLGGCGSADQGNAVSNQAGAQAPAGARESGEGGDEGTETDGHSSPSHSDCEDNSAVGC